MKWIALSPTPETSDAHRVAARPAVNRSRRTLVAWMSPTSHALLAALLVATIGCGGGGSDDTTSDGTASTAGTDTDSTSEPANDPADSEAGSPPAANPPSDDLPVELQSLVYLFEDEDPNRRMSALTKASKMGADAQPILDRIQGLSNDPDADVRVMVIYTLLEVDRDGAADSIAVLLDDEDETVQSEAILALTKLPISDAGPHITRMLEAEDDRLRAAAIRAVGELGIENDETISALESSLDSMDGSVIRSAIVALGQLISVESAPKIARCLTDRDEGVRMNACRVLGELGDDSDEIVGSLFRGLGDDTLGVREAAYRALVELTSPDDTFGYSPTELDMDTRDAAIEKWKADWEANS